MCCCYRKTWRSDRTPAAWRAIAKLEPADQAERVSVPPVVLFDNRPFPPLRDPSSIDCGGACVFTWDRRRLDEAAAVVFHIPTLAGIPLPAKAPGSDGWHGRWKVT